MDDQAGGGEPPHCGALTTFAETRRIWRVLATSTGLVVTAMAMALVGAPGARAHVCGDGSVLRAGEQSTVAVGLVAEDKAVVGVDIDVPDRFELIRVSPAPGWTITRSGRHIQYRAGRVEPFGCGYVNLRGVVRRAATFAIPFVLHYEDGSKSAFRSSRLGDLDLGQMLFVQAPDDTQQPSRSTTPLLVGLMGVAALMLIRRWRR